MTTQHTRYPNNHLILRGAICLMALCVFGISALFLWLKIAPPSLPFLKTFIGEKMILWMPGRELSIGDIRFAWPTGDFLPSLQVKDVLWRSKDGQPLFAADDIRMIYRILPLLQGHIAPVWIAVDHVRIHMPGISLPTGAPQSPLSGAASPEPLFPGMFQGCQDLLSWMQAHSHLKRIRLKDLELIFSGRSVTAASLVVDVKATTLDTSIAIRANLWEDPLPTRIAGRMHIPADQNPVSARLEFSGALQAVLPALFPSRRDIPVLDSPLQGTLEGSLFANGRIELPKIEIEAGNGSLAFPSVWETPLSIKKIGLTGKFLEGLTRLTVDALSLELDGLRAAAAGDIRDIRMMDDLNVSATVAHLSVRKAVSLWPANLAPDVRDYIRRHMPEGDITDATLSVRIRPEDRRAAFLPREAVDASVPFSGLTLDYYPPMAPLKQIQGRAVFSARDVAIGVEDGAVYDGTHAKGSVRIAGFDAPVCTIAIRSEASGPAEDLRKAVWQLTETSSEFLTIPKGQAHTRLEFDFPLTDSVADHFWYRADAVLDAMTIHSADGGKMTLRDTAASLVQGKIDILAKDGVWSHPALPPNSPSIKELALSGVLSDGAPGLSSVTVKAVFPQTTAGISGKIVFKEKYPEIDASLTVDHMAVSEALRFWPIETASAARTWFSGRFHGGNVRNARVRILLKPGDFSRKGLPENAIEAILPFAQTTMDYYPPLPLLEDASGVARFMGKDIHIEVASGRSGETMVRAGAVHITDYQGDRPVLSVAAEMDGPLSDMMKADQILKQTGKTEMIPIQKGKAATRLAVTHPLYIFPDSPPNRLSLVSDVSELDIPDLCGLHLTNGQFRLTVENDAIEARGGFRCGRVPLEIVYARSHGTDETLRVNGSADAAHLSDLGLPDLPFVRGILTGRTLVRFDGPATKIDIVADLTQIAIDLPRFGIHKSVGAKDTIIVKGIMDAQETVQLSSIQMVGPTASVQGEGVLTLGPQARSADVTFSQVKFGQTDLMLGVHHFPGQGVQMEITGGVLDASAFFGNSSKPEKRKRRTMSPKTQGKSWEIHAKLDRVIMANGQSLGQSRSHLLMNADTVDAADIHAGLAESKQLDIQLTRNGQDRNLTVRADDAGALLKALNLSEHLSGGTLDFAARLMNPRSDPQPAVGRLVIRDYTLKDTPVMVQLFSMASFIGIIEQLRSGGIAFSLLEADLSYQNETVVIEDGRMEGLALGMTIDGEWDTQGDMLNVSGVVVPFNMVNTMVRTLPIIGQFLVDDGLIAINYNLEGPTHTPKVSIHPLSTLSPGFTKKLLDRFSHPISDR